MSEMQGEVGGEAEPGPVYRWSPVQEPVQSQVAPKVRIGIYKLEDDGSYTLVREVENPIKEPITLKNGECALAWSKGMGVAPHAEYYFGPGLIDATPVIGDWHRTWHPWRELAQPAPTTAKPPRASARRRVWARILRGNWGRG